MIDRTIAPAYIVPDTYVLPKVNTLYLDNGIPLHLLLTGHQQVLRIEFIFRAGSWYEPQNGLSFFSAKMLAEGTTQYSSKDIQELFSFYGAFIELTSGHDNASFTVYFLSKYLKEILQLTHHILTCASFPDEELQNLKTIHSEQIKVNLEKNAYLASTAFREGLFGKNHPYGTHLSLEAIEQISSGNVSEYARQFLCLRNGDIFITGYCRENVYEEVNKLFGKNSSSNIHPKPSVNAESIHPDRSKRKLILREKSLQSSIRMGKQLFTIAHKDYFKMVFLNEILGGYFGSRLMQNIREDKGYTYGIHSSLQMMQHAGYMVIGTDVKREYTLHTIEEIYKEIHRLKTEPVSDSELQTVRNYMIGTFLSSLSTPFAAMDKFKTIYYNSLDYSFYDDYFKSLKQITSEDLMDVANRYLSDDFYEVIAGGET
ncbi:MAG: insulinase family protein [Cytophagaceae bacterium]|nr:insulinase family protein [Cytophagaceae bacterium]MDW8456144.1 pitrilysin family protein [Cytophagaceae bacterium]